MKNKLLGILVMLVALSISVVGAIYSVTGLSKLFSSVALSVMIMASFLEVAKIVTTILLHWKWRVIGFIKYYLSLAVIVLMFITSLGIYGFLTGAYQDTLLKLDLIDKQVAVIERQLDSKQESKTFKLTQLSQTQQSISDLREALSNNTIQYKDRETGQIITTTSSRNRRAYEKQLDQALSSETSIQTQIDELDSEILDLENQIVETETGNDLAAEVGPLKFLAELLDKPMGVVVNWLVFCLIFVFDPLAIILLIAAQKTLEESIPSEKPIVDTNDENDDYWTEEEIEDFNNQFNADNMLPDDDDEEDDILFEISNDPSEFDIDWDKTYEIPLIPEETSEPDLLEEEITTDSVPYYEETPQEEDWVIEEEEPNPFDDVAEDTFKIASPAPPKKDDDAIKNYW